MLKCGAFVVDLWCCWYERLFQSRKKIRLRRLQAHPQSWYWARWKWDKRPIPKFERRIGSCYVSIPLFSCQHFNVNSTLFQCCFNVDQRWNNVDSMFKMKQNPALDFSHRTKLIQRQCPTLKQRQNNVEQRWHNVVSTYLNVS